MAGRPATKKRGNGEGTLFYNKTKKLWVAQFYAEGKRKTKYGRTKDEARKKMIVSQNSIISGVYSEPSKITVEKWLYVWLKEYMIGKREPKTIENHENNIRNHIVPNIGKIKLCDLKAFQVQQMYNATEKRLSPRSVRLVHITLHMALKQAKMNDLLVQIVTEKCVLPKQTQKESRALTTGEQREFVKNIKGQPFELAFLLCLYAGLRRGEAFALQWKDIDTENLQLNINKTVSRVKIIGSQEGEKRSEILIKHPKSKSSNRIVPISASLLPYIKNHRIAMTQRKLAFGNDFNSRDLVFADTKGNPLDSGRLNTQFRKIAKVLFEEHATVHTLRHTFATRGAESGISMKVMQELCGHSDIGITANIYTHVSSEFKTQEIAKMNVIL